MTRFSDELRRIAAQAPDGDDGLAERAVRGARRRRAAVVGSVAGSVAAVLVAMTLGATAFLTTPSDRDTITGTVTDVLPERGVEPAAYAYYDFCGRRWDHRKNTHTFDQECAQWKVVTRGGQSFRVPDAVSVYTEQTSANYMNTGGPLAISADGRKIAYYQAGTDRFAVRDLADGTILVTPRLFPRAAMVKGGSLIRLSPDGRFLSVSAAGLPAVVVDMSSAEVTEVPEGWFVEQVGNGGAPVILRDGRDRLGRLEDGRVSVLSPARDDARQYGGLSPDGRVLPCIDGAETSDALVTKAHDTLVTLDAATGEVLGRARFRDAPAGFRVRRIGGWLGSGEVMVTGTDDADPVRGWKKGEPPTMGERVYAIDVRSGRVRLLATYSHRAWAGDFALPGF
ncbi:hypothetical protein [Nonomuraea candida]|uniref:hypothetical protein n=1 Tax=Nonomuraea candida TaxID=359159 RepID=UPI0005BA81B5|nr:hypothetical protein [Nonomuraea candida]